jgi:hypothetical protein
MPFEVAKEACEQIPSSALSPLVPNGVSSHHKDISSTTFMLLDIELYIIPPLSEKIASIYQ